MTKAELAKKKGLKTKEAPKTAAEAFITRNTSEIVKEKEAYSKEKVETMEPILQETASITEQKTNESIAPKRKGRPKKDPKKHCTVYLGLDIIDQLDIPLAVTGKNLSEYIESLIREDIKQKGDIYNDIYTQMKKVL